MLKIKANTVLKTEPAKFKAVLDVCAGEQRRRAI